MLVFTGCSCSNEATLSFDNLWGGKSIGYKESLSYSVAYSSDYAENNFSFVKADELSSLTVNISGTYTEENEIISKQDASIPQKVKDSAIFNSIDYTPSIIRSVTKLNLTAVYTMGDKTETSEDFISSESYFYNVDDSFAPIYTEREIDYKYPYVTSNGIYLNELKGKDYTEYADKKYVVYTEYGEGKETETEYEYTLKTIIDNSSLLLALRNKNIDLDTSYLASVVHPAYEKAQSLTIKRFADLNKTINFNYNGEEKTIDFAVKGLSFGMNSTNNSGLKQLVFVQNGEKENINKSLIVEYVSPLVEYSGFYKMGALVYTLNGATYA